MGLPCRSPWEELEDDQVLRKMKAEIRHDSTNRLVLELNRRKECNQQDREIYSESPRNDHECLDYHAVCRILTHENTVKDGYCHL
jgi:hypothetical protein